MALGQGPKACLKHNQVTHLLAGSCCAARDACCLARQLTAGRSSRLPLLQGDI